MPTPTADYEGTAQKLVSELGFNKEVKTSVGEIATLLDVPTSRISRTLQVMIRVGTAERRESWNGRGKEAFWTIKGDVAETLRRMKAQKVEWSDYAQSQPKSKPNGHTNSDADSPFAVLAPLRKSEPKAELEVARRYRDQQKFIDEQRLAFKEMGLDLPEPTPLYDEARRRELDAITRILPYIEGIENANTRLEEQNHTIRQPLSELNETRIANQRQRDQIEGLVREKSQIKDDVQRMMDTHKEEERGLKGRISELEGQLRQARGNRQIDTAVAVTEVQQAVTKQS